MKVAIVASDMPHHTVHAEAMAQGLGRHGIASTVYPDHLIPDEEIVACWGWRLGERLRAMGKDVLLMERGFIDRMNYCSLGWNGLNNRAQRRWLPINGCRFENLFGRMLRPWSADGDYALIIGQVAGDMAIKGVHIADWYAEAARQALKRFALPVKFRPHPMAIAFGQREHVNGAETLYGDLQPALERAMVVITYNSNAGVDAVLAGRPTLSFDAGSMAWPVTAHEFVIPGDEPDRATWAEQIAWSQFSVPEIASGDAWELVKDSRSLQ